MGRKKLDWDKATQGRAAESRRKTEGEADARFSEIMSAAYASQKELAPERAAYHLRVLAALPRTLQRKLKYGPQKQGGFAELKAEVKKALEGGEFDHKNSHYIETLITEAPLLDWVITP